MKLMVTDVFVPGGDPKYTYVSRTTAHYESQLQEGYGNLCKIITITGPTKSGKTVLTRKVFPPAACAWLFGADIKTADSFWHFIGDFLDIPQQHSRAEVNGKTHELGAEFSAEASIVIAKGNAKIVPKRSSSRQRTATAIVMHHTPSQVLKALRATRTPVIIDDFHYIDREPQKEIIRSLKSLVFEGVPVVFISIPHRRYDTQKAEPDMDARGVTVSVKPWATAELVQIPRLGFPRLNIQVDDVLSYALAAEAQGSPHLMQEFCKQLCVSSGINSAQDAMTRLTLHLPLESVYKKVAVDMGRSIFEKLSRGPRARTDRKPRRLKSGRSIDIYRVVLLAVARLEPGLETIDYETLRTSIREILDDDIPQAHEVSRVLEQMDKISSTDDSSVPVIDYEKEDRRLHITDPFFAFFLRWGQEEIERQMTN